MQVPYWSLCNFELCFWRREKRDQFPASNMKHGRGMPARGHAVEVGWYPLPFGLSLTVQRRSGTSGDSRGGLCDSDRTSV